MYIGQRLKTLDHLEPWELNIVLCCIVAVATECIMNAAVIMLMMPIIGSLVSSTEFCFACFMRVSATQHIRQSS